MTHEINQRRLDLSGTFNLRCLGGYSTGKSLTKWRRIFRSDSPHALDQNGILTMINHKVQTVIDLRSPAEVQHKPNPFNSQSKVNYQNISLFDDQILNYKPTEFPLLEIYKETLDLKKQELTKIINTIANSENGSVLFHCSAGKDRTGLVAALILSMVGVDQKTIIEDYALTEQFIEPHLHTFMTDAQRRGLNTAYFKPLLDCKPHFMEKTFEYVNTQYGSLSSYISGLQISESTITKIQNKLLQD